MTETFPLKKTQVVYQSSVELMEKLLEDPKTDNIKEAKLAIAEIVDMILSQRGHIPLAITDNIPRFYTYTHSVNVGILAILLSGHLFKNSYAHDVHEVGLAFSCMTWERYVLIQPSSTSPEDSTRKR